MRATAVRPRTIDTAGICQGLRLRVLGSLGHKDELSNLPNLELVSHFGSVHSKTAERVCCSPSMLTHATLPCRSRLSLSRPTSCAQVQQQQRAAAATRCMQPLRRVAAACSPLEQEGPAEPEQQQQQPQQPQEQQQAETIASAMHRSLSGARALRTLCPHARRLSAAARSNSFHHMHASLRWRAPAHAVHLCPLHTPMHAEVAKTTGRQNGSVNLFLVGESEETWRRLDKR